ncbi:MAG: alkyl/aryl-sulfatase [Candidatus Rhabdochlamydia sp.]|jgi:alkyl sulfatase BDS1-like metallo-beta-lactamase superfamily hydrolase|nr:linear primary-alkylsulfatase [Chlamydiota bacterium]
MKNLFVFFLSIQILNALPTSLTIEENQKVLKELPFDNQQDFEDAHRGFIAPLPNNGIIENANGQIIWNLKTYDFLENSSIPDSVNPSLWRQGRLLSKAGLFQVADRIYQVRGIDLSNMTIIEGKKGLIIIDPLVSIETARAALELYYQHRPKRLVKAVIYTHSHIDHFGGVRGVITQEEVQKGAVKIFAPQGFTQAALDESIMTGNAMARRASYMYGNLLKPGIDGQVTSGLGLTTSVGEISLILPTDFIVKTGEKKTIDGIRFVFISAPNSEAPAEMLFYLPDLKALCAAEDATHTMHNLYTLRGAKMRDAKAWAHYLNQTMEMFGEKAEVVFAQHHWPIWGKDRVVDFLEKQRDLYKYMHDQSLYLANQGYTMLEIGEMIKLPKELSQEWYNRGYYGTLNHNAKSVYCFYLGWFDGNPSTLHQLPPLETGQKMVEYMGGAEAILEKAQRDYDQGNYRWAAQVLNHLVFAEPSNQKAKDFLANILEQLGYQSENGPWRNFYLTGAQELRNGMQKNTLVPGVSPDIIKAMPTESLFDYLSIQLNGPRAADKQIAIYFELPDLKEKYLLQVKNGVLNYFTNRTIKADASIRMRRSDFDQIILGTLKVKEAEKTKKITVKGDRQILETFLSLFDTFDFWFKIVEPQEENSLHK